ncbi:C48 family peptidase [Mesorhizobium sp. M0621]|uniref:Ulp1 family isopeptidase n=1 Tax=Mesorhizobium sp. M0621 TaxID=2956974 RepID=UPI00333A7FCC
MMLGDEHPAPHTGGSGSMLGASVLQPGHSTARHHDAPDSSVVDLNPPAPSELRDHARSVPPAPAGPAFARAEETSSAVGEAAEAARLARLQKQMDEPVHDPGSGSMLGASVLQPGHSTARHHDAPDSSVVDLNPPVPFELRDHARSVPPAPAGPAFARAEETSSAVGEAAQAAMLARVQKQMDEPVHDPGPQVDTSPWEAQLDPPIVVSGRDKRPLYSNDATVIEGLRSALYGWPEKLLGEGNEDDAVLPSSFGPTGHHHQASDPAESFRPLIWRDGDQRAPDERIAAQDRSNLLPSEEVPLRPPEFAPPSLRAGNSASPELFPEGMSPAVEGFFGVFGDPCGRVLGALQLLGDEHIQRDYQLLEQELQGNNPDLAARTRFVDPVVANYHLRLGSESDRLSAFQRIVHNQNGNDTADFLFVPVSDAGTKLENRGKHWSLLFVDRRDRERPVAYHYDSVSGCHDPLAKHLAERLGASLETRVDLPRIAQQSNEWDCGVYVVDGTRALVGRLQRWQPDLPDVNLNNLVVNRQALQTRLMGDDTSGTANNLTNFELMDRHARDAVKESPVGTFHQRIKRLGQSARALHDRALAPVAPDQGNPDSVFVRDVVPGEPFKSQSLESKGDAAEQRSGPQEALGRPENLPGKANEDDAVLASSFVPTGHHHEASDPAESFGPLSGRHGDQGAPDEQIAALDRSNQLSSEEVLINCEHDTAELRPAKRHRTLKSRLQDVATEPQLSEIGNSGARVLMQASTHQVGALPWEAQPMMQGSGQEDAAAPYAGGSGSMQGASVLQPGHSTARHHHAPDSSVVDLNPPAPFELRDHARSVPAAVQPDPPIVVSGRDKGPLYSNDATVVEGLRSAYAGAKRRAVTRYVNSLSGFGHWLLKNNKPGFAARLHEESLDKDLKEYLSRGGSSDVARALGRLKTSAGGAPVVDRPVRNPYPADAALIRDYKAALIKGDKAAPATGPNRGTIQVYGSTLIRFSEYLHENKKPGIAARLHEGSLDEDAKRYMDSSGIRWISALAHLRKFPPCAALGREIALAARPEDAVGMEARAIGDAAAQHSGPSEEVPLRPPELAPPSLRAGNSASPELFPRALEQAMPAPARAEGTSPAVDGTHPVKTADVRIWWP